MTVRISLLFPLTVLCATALGFCSVSAARASSCPAPSRTLAVASSGIDVSQLRSFLITQNRLSPGSATGYFGRLPEAAAQYFQTANNLVSSGSSATAAANGPHTGTAAARDAAGNTTISPVRKVVAQNAVAPPCILTAPTTAPVNSSSQLSWTTTGAPTSAVLKRGSTILTSTPTLPTGSFTTTAPATAGSYTYSLSVTNAAGTDSCSSDVNVTAPVNCFTSADNARHQFRVIRVGPAPHGDYQPSYLWYPLTDATNENLNALNDARNATSIDQYFYQNANRCNEPGGTAEDYDSCAVDPHDKEAQLNLFPFPRWVCEADANGKGMTGCQNVTNSLEKEVRIWYKSYRQADACTLAQVAAALAYDDAKIDSITAGMELTVVRDDPKDPYRARLTPLIKNRGTANRRFENLCVLPDKDAANELPSHIKGIFLDYEVFDGRSPALAQSFARQISKLASDKAKKMILYTTPLTAARTLASGVVDNGGPGGAKRLPKAFLDIFEYVNVHNFGYGPGYGTGPAPNFIPHSNPDGLKKSLNDQLNMIEGGAASYSRIMLAYNWADMSIEESKVMREIMLTNRLPAAMVMSNHLSGVRNIARYKYKAGGSCDTPLNKSLACFLFGECLIGPH